jgi:probable phosphoglycerate mutase
VVAKPFLGAAKKWSVVMTRLILMRHGYVEGIYPERFRGRAEIPLSPLGIRQGQALAERVATNFAPAALYTSPMQRCIATADLISRKINIPPQPLMELQDIDYGEWQGLTHEIVKQQWPELYDRWKERPHLMRFPGGESLQDVVSRTANVVREMLLRYPGESDQVLLMGHDSVNRAALLQLLDQPLSAYWRLEQSPCAINEIVIDKQKISVRRVNDTSHLERLDLAD